MANTSTSIRTYTGRHFDILDPRPNDVHVKDIAHALSLLCRFCGHVRRFYSVAQHSVLVSNRVGPQHAFWGLLHDASEAYVADLSRPLKHAPEMSRYRTAEKHVMAAIAERFGLSMPEPPEVKLVDRRMCATEMRDLMGAVYDWGAGQEPFPGEVVPWSPEKAEAEFLRRYYELRFNTHMGLTGQKVTL